MGNIEVWKSLKNIVKNGENYEVSNLGNVRSIDRYVTNSNGITKLIKGKILKKGNHTGGYHNVALTLNGNPKSYYVHILVAKTFIINSENKPEVNHKDGDKKNNQVVNLEWSTPKENTAHARSTGLCNQNGEDSIKATLTNKLVEEIRSMYESELYTQRELAVKFGMDFRKINQIVNYKTYR
jgi:hypothetical protein